MPINRVGSKGIEDGSVATVDLAPGTVTNAKLTNSSFTFDGTSVSLGASENISLSASWQSVITADGSTGTTAVAGNGYFIDTTSAAHTLTLPASATIGDFIAIKDYAGTFATNNLIIARNGHNIQGLANDSLITTNRASLVLVYVDSTKGWLYWEEHNVAALGAPFVSATGGTITTSGDYKIHTFTGDGCFVVSEVGPSSVSPVNSTVQALVVAGGGAGGSLNNGGGGGAGGFRNISDLPVSVTTYPISVGSGGTVPASPPASGTSGSTSVFSTITSAGGGGGSGTAGGTGGSGGSGGGAGGQSVGSGGAGNTPPVSPPQGFAGGGSNAVPCTNQGGGGGGSSEAGNTDGAGFGGDGTDVSSTYPGTPNCGIYAGGGGGGCNGPINPGGTGGGGAGAHSFAVASTTGTANTGGGGGGGASFVDAGANGGKGIVIIKYKFQ